MEYPQQVSNSRVHIQLLGIFRRHSWSEYLYLTLRTPPLGTELQIFTHTHAHLGVRMKWMDGAHTSPNSISSCQLPWHSWSEDLCLTLRTPALGTELQMCTHVRATGVRVRWTDRTHASPDSLFRAANTQLATRESQLSAHSSTQELQFIKVSNQRLPNSIFKLKGEG